RYSHGWLPVDEETGRIGFVYQGTLYEGLTLWEGLDRIQDDIRNTDKPLSELHEALELVNSWYADKTTTLKPEHLKTYVQEIGLEKIYSQIGIRIWMTGHNPLNKLHSKGLSFKVVQGDRAHFSVDKGMSWRKYNDFGGYVVVNADGIKLRGFCDTAFEAVVDNPPTVKLKEENGLFAIEKSWDNEPLAREDFLRIVRAQLQEEKDREGAASSPIKPVPPAGAIPDRSPGKKEETPLKKKVPAREVPVAPAPKDTVTISGEARKLVQAFAEKQRREKDPGVSGLLSDIQQRDGGFSASSPVVHAQRQLLYEERFFVEENLLGRPSVVQDAILALAEKIFAQLERDGLLGP
ncbi:MAG: hypothetical protein NUW09_07865, partial [Deltaproteobacteria bacterium]|nr:hypothetical protein [Deltaproteobacteria bacterium]